MPLRVCACVCATRAIYQLENKICTRVCVSECNVNRNLYENHRRTCQRRRIVRFSFCFDFQFGRNSFGRINVVIHYQCEFKGR